MLVKHSLLLVEDNPDDEEVTLRGLRKAGLPNLTVHVVRDGQEALDFLFKEGQYCGNTSIDPPDLIVLDLSLPRVPGLEVLKQVRSDERFALIPVVILTSSNEETDRLKSYVSGANSYVQKPVGYVDFVQAVAHLGIYWIQFNEAV